MQYLVRLKGVLGLNSNGYAVSMVQECTRRNSRGRNKEIPWLFTFTARNK